MARKPQRRMPQVPRSAVQSSPTPREGSAPASVGGPASATSIAQTMEQEYAYVRGDLLRIVTFAALIFGIMLILRFVVGL